MKKQSNVISTLLLINTMLLTGLYYWLGTSIFPYMHIVYLAVGILFGLAYVLYNRGFVGTRITPDQLPCTMSEQEREEFVATAKARLQRSRWMLVLIIPIVAVILIDLCYLFLLPLIREVLM